jgi:hypothetical protein
MEDVLDLYARDARPHAAGGVLRRKPNPADRPDPPADRGSLGPAERYDCEYRRNGTVNLFVFLDAHRPWRRVKVTDRRTNQDFAVCMRELVDVHYPEAALVYVVLDKSINPFGRRLVRRLPGTASPACAQAPGVPPHTKARQLAEHGRDQDRASCAASAWTSASTTRISSSPKSPPGNTSEAPPKRASTGCSLPREAYPVNES